MRPRRPAALAAALAGAIGLWLAAGAAEAHPHVFIDNVATLVFDQRGIAAIRLRWTFDEIFSAGIIAQFDKNKDRKFDAEELKALKAGAFDNLQGFDYFTHLTVDDRPVPVRRVTDFAAAIEKDQLVYEFTVPLDQAVDPRRQRLVLGVYDVEYFVDIDIGGKDAVRFERSAGISCKTSVLENPRRPIDRKSTRLNSSHSRASRMPSSA